MFSHELLFLGYLYVKEGMMLVLFVLSLFQVGNPERWRHSVSLGPSAWKAPVNLPLSLHIIGKTSFSSWFVILLQPQQFMVREINEYAVINALYCWRWQGNFFPSPQDFKCSCSFVIQHRRSLHLLGVAHPLTLRNSFQICIIFFDLQL